MNHTHIRTIEDAGRTTAVWSEDIFDAPSRGVDIAKAILPAALILIAATLLLVTLV